MTAKHIDWDDPDQVKTLTREAFSRYKHLNETASSGGSTCPNCASTKVKLLDEKKEYVRNIKIRHCLQCDCRYIQYNVDYEESDKWSPPWRHDVVSYAIEGFPYYIYFKPGTHTCEGVGPGIMPWET
jgi:hypothetical protein